MKLTISELKTYMIVTVYVTSARGHIHDKGLYQYLGMDGNDHLFKSVDWKLSKKYNLLMIPKEVMDRFTFKPHSYISNGLVDMPEIEDKD